MAKWIDPQKVLPKMAVGRAVVEFRKTIIVGSIEHISFLNE